MRYCLVIRHLPEEAGSHITGIFCFFFQTEGGPFSNSLNQISVMISEDDECNNTYVGSFIESSMCARAREEGKGPCYVSG
jgi:hypothetical protein